MDDMDGVTLFGDVKGTVINGATLTPGKRGRALYLDGNDQYAIFPKHVVDECFSHPGLCSEGMTLSMWIIIFENQPATKVHWYDNGGSQLNAIGYRFQYLSQEKSFDIKVGDGIRDYYYKAKWPISALGQWVLFTLSWEPGSGINVYLNGCDMDADNTLGYASDTSYNPRNVPIDLYIGIKYDMKRPAHVKIDELIFWDKVLSPPEIWQIYTDDM